jgi:histidinol-phosphate phosphatase family protein
MSPTRFNLNDMNTSEQPKAAIFFDKDGTLVENVPYNVDCSRLRLVPGGGEAARMLHEAGYVLVVVTNQSGIARGYFRASDLRPVEVRLRTLLAAEGAPLAGFYFCPHSADGVVPEYTCLCNCRKPMPGMMLRAALDLHLDLQRSWLIGDLLDDVEAGHRAGCRAALVDCGGETLWQRFQWRKPELMASDLLEAARQIITCSTHPVKSIR